MTKGELIQRLLALQVSDDTEVMVNRGEWGACRFSDEPLQPTPYVALVLDQGKEHNWEIMFPELPPDDGEKRTLVVLI
jgi:hypothetical protein